MIFTRDFVTREKHRQIASLVTQKLLLAVTHALFFISHIPDIFGHWLHFEGVNPQYDSAQRKSWYAKIMLYQVLLFNSSPSGQNGRRFVEDSFRSFFAWKCLYFD